MYKLSDEQQGTYLMNRIDVIPVQRRRHGQYEDTADSKRQCTMTYTVPSNTGLVQVCAKTFKDIFSLTNRRLQTLNGKKKLGHVAYSDGRGKTPSSHKHKQKYTDDDWNLVREHIQSFPRQESHYGRNKSSREYLSSDLNFHRMHIAFTGKHPESKVEYRFYQRVFRKCFPNLYFGLPKTDTCRVCDMLQCKIKVNETATGQFSIRTQLTLHQKKAQKALGLLTKSMNESQLPASDLCCLSMDLQQVMFCPTLTHSNMFYSRQLSNYNLCVHLGDNNKSYMCMWHEAIAGRGGNEIASCFFKVLKGAITAKNKIELWCDNCVAQNKNRMLLMAVIYLVARGCFKTIDIKYLVSGHSYMPCDRDFGVIEKRKRKCTPMVPEEVQEVVRSARVTNPFTVLAMKEEDFFDFGKVADRFLNTTKLQLTKLSWIRVCVDNPTSILVKKSFNEIEEWSECLVFKKSHNLQQVKTLENLPQCKTSNHISAEKKKDLLSMLDFMDVKYHSFYRNICQ